MGTIVYSSLIDLLLNDGDKTKDEMVKEAIDRFEFPTEMLNNGLGLGLVLRKISKSVLESNDGKYHLVEYDERSRNSFLGFKERAPEGYFKERPHIEKLMNALEEAFPANGCQ